MAAVSSTEQKPDIILNSPVGSKPAVYKWPLTWSSKGQKIDGAEEIIETIRWVAHEYIDFKPAIENLLSDQPDLKSYDCIKTLCDKYNKITDYVMKMNKGTSIALKTSSRAPPGLLKHMIQQVYNYAVSDPTELNKYSPFSSETYGETSFEFMAQLIDRNQFKPKEQDIFIDLGSGVGHLVLQMAATVKCKKCYGIEIADVPAGYAKLMEERFKFWMNWHGKTYTEFELIHGDFFEKKYTEIIKSSTYILCNNFAFKPDDDHKLKQKFLDLKDGTQILSSKPFCSPKNRLSERHLSDIGSIMQVVEIQPDQKKDTVSWTPKPLPYYLHVLDSTKMERYYERQKRRQGRGVGDKGRQNKRRKSGKGDDSLSDDSDANTVYGPTTRKAWSEWCNASSVNTSNRNSTDSLKTATSSRNNSTDTENLSESAIDDCNPVSSIVTQTSGTTTNSIGTSKNKEGHDVVHKREKKTTDKQNSTESRGKSATSQEPTTAQGGNKSNKNSNLTPKSCLDKKRDYAIKKTSGPSSFIETAQTSTLYSISKPAEPTNGNSSASKIPNIVIKVKPPSESKNAGSSASSNNSTTLSPKDNSLPLASPVKKLRQRKKSLLMPSNDLPVAKASTSKAISLSPMAAQALTNILSGSSSTASSSTNPTTSGRRRQSGPKVPSTNGTVPTIAPSGRGKRGAKPKANAGVITNLASAPGPSGVATVKEPAPTARSTKKGSVVAPDKNLSLDLLHTKTLESVMVNPNIYTQPAPGCENYSLRSIVETPSLPRVVIKDSSMFVSSFMNQRNMDRFVDVIRGEFDSFTKKLQNPGTRESLQRSIEIEQIKNRNLRKTEDDLTRDIKNLTDRVPKAMKPHCDELGVASSQRSLVLQLGAMLKRHQELAGLSLQLEASLQPPQRPMHPPVAHSSNQHLGSNSHHADTNSATLDLSLKQAA